MPARKMYKSMNFHIWFWAVINGNGRQVYVFHVDVSQESAERWVKGLKGYQWLIRITEAE